MRNEDAKQTLIHIYRQCMWGNGCEEYGCSECEEALNMAIEALKQTAWIPVGERLPDVDVEVLTTTDWSEVLIAWHRKDGTWETDEYILASDEILAWMPLPTPYKGGEDE